MTTRYTRRSLVFGVVLAFVAAMMAMTRTQPFPCEDYLKNNSTLLGKGDAYGDPRRKGCLFRKHINDRTFASVTQEGRIQRDTDTFLWSLFGNAFAVSAKSAARNFAILQCGTLMRHSLTA
jgi:hypothetical protein